MNSTTRSSFSAAQSTATTTTATTQKTTQQATNTSANILDWLLIEVPLINALGVGTVLAALITGIFQLRIHGKNQEHANRLEEARRNHEEKMQHLKDEYEENRQRRVEKFRLIDDWRKFLEDDSIAMAGLYEKYNSTLKKHFSDETNRRILKAIEKNTEQIFQLQMSIIEEGFEFNKERERLHRLDCVREDLVKALSQELTSLEIEMKRY